MNDFEMNENVDDAPLPVDEGVGTAEAEPAPTSSLPPPSSWSAEAREHWGSLPPQVQQYTLEREIEAQRKISTQGQSLAELRLAKMQAEQERQEWQRQQEQLNQFFADPRQAALAVMQKGGVKPSDLFEAEAQQLRERMSGEFRQLQAVKLQHEMAEAEREIASLLQERPHISRVPPEVQQQIVAQVRAAAPGLPIPMVLRLAADQMEKLTGVKEQFAQEKAEREERENKAREAARLEEQSRRRWHHVQAAKKAAAVNTKSSPASNANPKNWEDELSEIARSHF